jgi:hemin uptake protein HemP
MESGTGASQRSTSAESSVGEATSKDAPEWNSEQLFGRAQEIAIRHEGHLYRLRRTKLGKLILTK